MKGVDEKYFWSCVDIKGDDECWPWKKSLKPNGYGQTAIGMKFGHTRLAHRMAFQIANPDVDVEGKLILHSCDNKKCCNPSHLSPGTDSQNIKEYIERVHIPCLYPWIKRSTLCT